MSLRHGGRLALLVALVALLVPGTASAASVTPTTTSSNPGCADINSSWSEIKVDNVPQEKTYSAGDRTVTVSNVQNQKTFDWSSNFPVTAVIVKASTITYVYQYDPAVMGDTNMDSPGKYAISHVAWCYNPSDTPPPNPCGSADMDNDGVNDGCDNCPSVSNPDQTDSNDNGMGDACEPQPTCAEAHAGEADSDGDGVVDACDNCPTVMNPGQEDSNGNGTGDACEGSENPPSCQEMHAGSADGDGDGVVDACDNCPTTMNPGQEDSDHNGVGDACEPTPPADQQQTAPASDSGQAPAQEPGAQAVLGERVSAPTARLQAASGCMSRAFNARVRGSQIARVVFRLDGKRTVTVVAPNRAGLFTYRVNPAKLRVGVHRLVATVYFKSSTRTGPRTFRASFQRCGKRLIAPRFTG